MLSSEPQFRTRVSPVIHLPQRAWWFPWAWLKEQELAQAQGSQLAATVPTLGMAALALPPQQLPTPTLRSFLSHREEPAAHFLTLLPGEGEPWGRSWICGQSWAPSARGSRPPHTVPPVHMRQHRANRSKCPGISVRQRVLSAHLHFPRIQPEHTTTWQQLPRAL